MRAASWLLASLVACGSTAPTAAPGPTPPTAASEPSPTSSALAPRSDASVPSESPDPVAVRINERYARRDASDWDSFEREGREVFDHRTRIVDALALAPGDVVADVGAGTGLFTLEFARRVGPRGRVFAVDVQPYFREHIAERAAQAGLENITTVVADQRHSGLAADSVDVAFLCDAYHHLELPQTYLADLHRALRPGARLVVVDYDRTRAGVDAWMRKHVRADPEQFRREIEGAGFRLVDTPALLRENFVMIFERPADETR
ncbi:MAG: methyltransferase domain-containing protein [Deltaproteobacteria bacterium]|nr:methyltransferase domain-containing protein [Deltaproteobacteria bacterium]MBK8241507.1 methyltransferase domain-containing protein [Deltaproteobacteria bacterium]MBK8713877.1 methyltransferase domain-containing protein [Deltaproteobacteria bacterium]MBP7290546.1 methyltransferase domain-containing protein [Nannocystaceae bacterium]